MLQVLRWALIIFLALVSIAAFFVVVAAALGFMAGAGAWALFHFVDPRLFGALRFEFFVAVVTIGLVVFLAIIGRVFGR